jgi:hypothetical protein
MEFEFNTAVVNRRLTMNHLMLFQLKLARDWSIEVAQSCPNEWADIQMNEFNNTIQWQAGHILTVAERMLFDYPNQTSFLPLTFTKWFESGTRPTDWIEHPPSLEELIILLNEQQIRILSITPEQFDIRFNKPLFGFASYGECASFAAIHETLHVGKMEEMIRLMRHR